MQRQLATFQSRYLREVGVLYAELDEWKARTSELRAKHYPSDVAAQSAEQAREQAHQTYQGAHGEAANVREVAPSPELKSLFRELAKRIHPDLAKNAEDRDHRTRLMVEANRAYGAGDAEELRRILDHYHGDRDSDVGEGVGAELIRIIRQTSQMRQRLARIDYELSMLRQSELAASIRKRIELAEWEYKTLSKQVGRL